MSSINKVVSRPMVRKPVAINAEGSKVRVISKMHELRRSVLAYMLWENDFYENGINIAARIKYLVHDICNEGNGDKVAALAVEARSDFNLRHVPLLIVREMARNLKGKAYVAATLEQIIQRPDELKEFLAIYWKEGKQPLSAQVKKGLAAATLKFNEYSLAKYNGKGAVNLKDVVHLVHPKPATGKASDVLARLLKNELATPDTWEVELSAGKDKKATFTRLIEEDKLGALALLRNLRNMEQSGVSRTLVGDALVKMDVSRVLPFRFIAAAKYAPSLEPQLEKAMFKALEGFDKLKGRTALIIDHSGSMSATVSAKSELSRLDAASALAILARELCENCRVFTFGTTAMEIPARRGFALRDAILKAPGGSSYGTKAIKLANAAGYDRIIVLTDGQWHTEKASGVGYANMGGAISVAGAPLTDKAYMLNVGTYKNGVGYGKWFSIDGWSEQVLSYILAIETMKD